MDAALRLAGPRGPGRAHRQQRRGGLAAGQRVHARVGGRRCLSRAGRSSSSAGTRIARASASSCARSRGTCAAGRCCSAPRRPGRRRSTSTLYRAAFADLGVEVVELDRRRTPAVPRDAGGVFLTGGKQSRLAEAVRGTAVESRDPGHLGRAAASSPAPPPAPPSMGETMLARGPSDETPSEDEVRVRRRARACSPACSIDQHFAERGRIGRLATAIAARPDLLGIGIDEDTAVVVDGRPAAGSSGREASTCSTAPATPTGLRFHLLAAGDRVRPGGPGAARPDASRASDTVRAMTRTSSSNAPSASTPTQDLGAVGQRHRVRRAERHRVRQREVQVVDEVRGPARRDRRVDGDLGDASASSSCGKRKSASGSPARRLVRFTGPPRSSSQKMSANAMTLTTQTCMAAAAGSAPRARRRAASRMISMHEVGLVRDREQDGQRDGQRSRPRLLPVVGPVGRSPGRAPASAARSRQPSTGQPTGSAGQHDPGAGCDVLERRGDGEEGLPGSAEHARSRPRARPRRSPRNAAHLAGLLDVEQLPGAEELEPLAAGDRARPRPDT